MESRISITAICLFLCISCGLITIGMKSIVYQDVEIQNVSYTADGVTLRAFLIKPKEKNGLMPGLIVFHGFSSSKEAILPLSIEIAKNGYIVLTPDLRGHGKSEGIANFDLNEIIDIEAGLKFLKSQNEVDPARIGFLGQSLGGAVALISGAKLNVTAVVGISTFANLTAWSKEVGFLGLHRISYFFHSGFPREKEKQEYLSPISYVENLTSVLLIHGSNDHYIPKHHTEDLYNKARGFGIPTDYVVIEGGDHDLPHQSILTNVLPWLKNALNSPQSSNNVSKSSQLIFLALTGLSAVTILSFFLSVLFMGHLVLEKNSLILSHEGVESLKNTDETPKKVTEYILILLGLYISIHIISEISIALFSPIWKIEGGIIFAKILLLILIGSIAYFTQNFPKNIENRRILIFQICYILLGILSIFISTMIFGSLVHFPFLGIANLLTNLPILLFIGITIVLDEIFFREQLYCKFIELNLSVVTEGALHVVSFTLSKLLIIAAFLFVFNLFEIRLLFFAGGFFCIIGIVLYSLRRWFSFIITISFSIGINLFLYLTMMTTLFIS